MNTVRVDGKSCVVVETLPYHGIGRAAKVVIVNGAEKTVVKDARGWRVWTARDRLGGSLK